MRKIVLILLLFVVVACNTPPPQSTPVPTPDAAVAEKGSTAGGAEVENGTCAEYDLAGQRQMTCILVTAVPTATVTIEPTHTHEPTPTLEPTSTPEPTATPGPIDAYAAGPLCPPEAHNDRLWHELWNSQYGCHYTHHHADDPHLMDHIFGGDAYTWMGGELSSAWQTFSGAGPHHEQPGPEACMENICKHNFYKVYTVENFPCGLAPGAQNCVVNARIWAHIDPAQIGARVRFHSIFVEAEICHLDGTNCGFYHGGGHWDSGKLLIPRDTYFRLDGDPPEWANLPVPAEPYRAECDPVDPVQCLESWQSVGSQWEVPEGDIRLLTGFGVHLGDPWGPVDLSITDNPMTPGNVALTNFYCDGEVVDGRFYPEPGCRFNGSEATVFRAWVTVPAVLDNGEFDTDPRPGFFSHEGYTDRYGAIVTGCTEPALDCVPVLAEGVPVGKSGLRGGVGMGYDREYDYCQSDGVIVDCGTAGAESLGWLTYP